MPFDPAYTYNQPLEPSYSYSSRPVVISFDPAFRYDNPYSPDIALPLAPVHITFNPAFSYNAPIDPDLVSQSPVVITFNPAFAYDAPFDPDITLPLGPVVISFDPASLYSEPLAPGFGNSPLLPVKPLQSIIQKAINLGYAQTGKLIGTPFRHHRPSPAGAISIGTYLGVLNVSFAQNGNYKKPGKVGNDEWFGYYDATTVQPGDYFTNGNDTYFIASQQPLLPYLTVYCERLVFLTTVTSPSGVGVNTYGGDLSGDNHPVITAWPASIVQGSRGERGDITLPEDVRSPWWTIRLPATPGIVLQNSMFITDDLSRRYSISSAEKTVYGWRITARSDQS